VAYTCEYGVEIDRQSSLNFLKRISPLAALFLIFGESDERFHVGGGNDLVVGALARKLEGRIETNTVLESIGGRADGAFRLSVRRGAVSRVVDAPYVVLALPFTALRDVRLDLELPAVKRRSIVELGYGTNAKLMVGFSERVWRRPHGASGSVVADLPFQTTWETSRHQEGRSGVLTNFTGGRHGVELGRGTAAEQAALLVRDLESVWPGVQAARVRMPEVRFHWPSHPWTRGSYASYLVGQWTTIGRAEGEPVGRMHFAGEHCSQAAQGFMEGGCETGEAAAAAILERAPRPGPRSGYERARGTEASTTRPCTTDVQSSPGLYPSPRGFGPCRPSRPPWKAWRRHPSPCTRRSHRRSRRSRATLHRRALRPGGSLVPCT
jgi:monoamine oxidase